MSDKTDLHDEQLPRSLLPATSTSPYTEECSEVAASSELREVWVSASLSSHWSIVGFVGDAVGAIEGIGTAVGAPVGSDEGVLVGAVG